ncbi:hypothetical protein EDD36DRAFT_85376 [Exophiala viscosa]|uniref:Uncharacterized protein n=1 Tax=Exophiala viscosa TaxID=2486360 RepID=A0AAN6DM53_9EURO|nr:hypothetical protein EDD36DRAFT_85376 [Exophiala viscosa]
MSIQNMASKSIKSKPKLIEVVDSSRGSATVASFKPIETRSQTYTSHLPDSVQGAASSRCQASHRRSESPPVQAVYLMMNLCGRFDGIKKAMQCQANLSIGHGGSFVGDPPSSLSCLLLPRSLPNLSSTHIDLHTAMSGLSAARGCVLGAVVLQTLASQSLTPSSEGLPSILSPPESYRPALPRLSAHRGDHDRRKQGIRGVFSRKWVPSSWSHSGSTRILYNLQPLSPAESNTVAMTLRNASVWLMCHVEAGISRYEASLPRPWISKERPVLPMLAGRAPA